VQPTVSVVFAGLLKQAFVVVATKKGLNKFKKYYNK
jgi:hypothetical protein